MLILLRHGLRRSPKLSLVFFCVWINQLNTPLASFPPVENHLNCLFSFPVSLVPLFSLQNYLTKLNPIARPIQLSTCAHQPTQTIPSQTRKVDVPAKESRLPITIQEGAQSTLYSPISNVNSFIYKELSSVIIINFFFTYMTGGINFN